MKSIIRLIPILLLFMAAYTADAYTGQVLFQQNHRQIDRLSVGAFSALASKNNLTFMIYCDTSRRPRIVKYNHNTGASETRYLDTNSNYKALEDGHHYFAIGIDRDGYIHVVGDMHDFPYLNIDHLPSRYKPQPVTTQDYTPDRSILYWKSNSPYNINNFTFMGQNSSKRIQGYGHSYSSFVTDRNGRLYYYGRVWGKYHYHLPWNQRKGSRGYTLQRYNKSSGNWTALGREIPYSGAAKIPSKMVFWENAGVTAAPLTTHYQGYKGQFIFDRSNRLHTAFTMSDSTAQSPEEQSSSMRRLMYMWCYAGEVGQRWRKVGGSSHNILGRQNAFDTYRDSFRYKRIETNLAIDKDSKPIIKWIDTSNNPDRAKWTMLNNAPSNSGAGWTMPRNLVINNSSRRIFTDRLGETIFVPNHTSVWSGSSLFSTGVTHTGINPQFSGWISENRLYQNNQIIYAGRMNTGAGTSVPAIGLFKK
ncbi:MAG: BNR-4 repeat-containing protein [Verrucomicrobiota bacterium]